MQKKEILKYRIKSIYMLLIEKQENLKFEKKKISKNIVVLFKRIISLALSLCLALTMGIYLIPRNNKNDISVDDEIDEAIVYTNNEEVDFDKEEIDIRKRSIAYIKLLVCIEGILCLIRLKLEINFGIVNGVSGTYHEVCKLYELGKDKKYIDERIRIYLEEIVKLSVDNFDVLELVYEDLKVEGIEKEILDEIYMMVKCCKKPNSLVLKKKSKKI